MSEAVAGWLLPVAPGTVSGDDVADLFAELRRLSQPVCANLRGIGRRDTAAERAYFRNPGPFVRSELSSRYGAISGCWNYVRMNDRRPDRDLEVIARAFPAQMYECAAVGVMQPYLLAAHVPCRSMTLVDFDWRVHDLHAQIFTLARAGGLMQRESLAGDLAGLTTSWLALREVAEDGQAVGLADLCSPWMRERCENALLLSAARLRGEPAGGGDGSTPPPLERWTASLAPLHEADYELGPPGARSLLYFSNALEPMYTPGEEFRALMLRLEAGLIEGRRAVIVHHAGGRENFGLYELWNPGEGLKVRVLCRDPYPETRKGHAGETYKIALDRVAARDDDRTPPTCRSLAR